MNLDEKKFYFSWREAILNSELAPTTRHVLLTLGCHMNDLGESCYPSIELLAKETGLSKVSVINHIGIAVKQGWITASIHGYSGQGWRRHQYSIGPGPLELEGDKPTLPASETKVVNVVNKGGKASSENVVNVVNPSTSKSTPRSTSVVSARRIIPPDLEQVKFYMQEIGTGEPEIEARKFVDHHSARGWKFKGNILMKDWQAAVRTWSRNQESFSGGNGGNGGGFLNKADERTQHNARILSDFVARHS